jgi:prophage regulatory protein
MSDRILRRPEVVSVVGLGTTKLYELISEGKFPKPVKLSARSVGWLESEVQEWIKEQAEKRQGAA